MDGFPRRIHILGIGNIGKLVAHALSEIPDRPPITLLVRQKTLLNSWLEEGETIKIIRNEVTEESRGFDVELSGTSTVAGRVAHRHSAPQGVSSTIYNLVVTSKAYDAVNSLRSVRHRLTHESTVLFLYNGIGYIDEVNAHVFPDPKKRPTYIVGITSHGVSKQPGTSFSAVHNGIGTTALGVLPRGPAKERGDQSQTKDLVPGPTTRYLLRTLTRATTLQATGYSASGIQALQLEKLVVNCMINPFTAIYDCRNGDLLSKLSSDLMSLVFDETVQVVQSLPELEGAPQSTLRRLSAVRLKNVLVGVLQSTADNVSSMLADVRQGRMTEIDYMNGFVVERAKELGLDCSWSEILVGMVKDEISTTVDPQLQQLQQRVEDDGNVPFDHDETHEGQ